MQRWGVGCGDREMGSGRWEDGDGKISKTRIGRYVPKVTKVSRNQ